MNVETTTSTTPVTNQNVASAQQSCNTNSANKDGNSFKDELNTQAKNGTNETKEIHDAKEVKEAKEDKKCETVTNPNNKDNYTNQKLAEFELQTEKLYEKELFNSICDLNEKIESLNELKNFKVDKFSTGVEKNQYIDKELTEKSDLCRTINMDKSDTVFFLNLVENNTMMAQSITSPHDMNNQVQFQEIKAEATQKTVAVSHALLDSLNESMKTNKPFRIDFGDDIAVIMKVDKDGILSANFIPGSTAVENYLRNNIGYLRQSFDEQNLEYNELSYTKQDSKKQKQNNRNTQQENKES